VPLRSCSRALSLDRSAYRVGPGVSDCARRRRREQLPHNDNLLEPDSRCDLYHLEIDDPSFGSPGGRDGAGTQAFGQRLNLTANCQAAYVRINNAVNANTFSPSYFNIGEDPR
jgi:hypothetical protein